MEELANRHWDGTGSGSRITWIKSVVKRYFLDGDWKRIVRRAKRRSRAAAERPSGSAQEAKCPGDVELDAGPVIRDKLRTLDVGSCFNPFRDVTFMDVTAIDLSPATSDVYACDFLTVPITDEERIRVSHDGDGGDGELSNGGSSVKTVAGLPKGRYDVVIFCLLLEYLPTPGMRYEAVKRAAELLADYGLLIIVTPDSSHQVGDLIQDSTLPKSQVFL